MPYSVVAVLVSPPVIYPQGLVFISLYICMFEPSEIVTPFSKLREVVVIR